MISPRSRPDPADARDPLGVVAGEAAQELGSALTAMQVAVDRLERRWRTGAGQAPQSEDLPDEFSLLWGQQERLARLARRLLMVARPTPVSPVLLDLSAELRHLLAPLERALAREGIRLDTEGLSGQAPDPSDPVPVVADPARVREVVLALVANARRAVLEGEPPRWIRLTLVPSAPGGGEDLPRVELRIRDSGSGVPAGAEDRIFLPFVSGWGGEGLGLSRARVSLAHQGGELLLRRPDPPDSQASEFVLRLPLHVPPPVLEPASPHGPDPLPGAGDDPRLSSTPTPDAR